MTDADVFAAQLLEEAKRYLERTPSAQDQQSKEANLHASLLLAFASLEAHLNSIADDFLVRPDLSPLDRSILAERELVLEDGEWLVTDKLKMYRIEDRIEYLHRRFSPTPLDKSSTSWSALKAGLQARNRLIHPKGPERLSEGGVRQSLQAVIDVLDTMYHALYKRPFPAARRGLQTTMNF